MQWLAMAFRLVSVLVIGWLLHQHALRVQAEGQRPIRISEVQMFLPDAHRLTLRTSPNGGLRVLNQSGKLIGYASRTMPHSRRIKGYSGPSDMLLVFDIEENFLGTAFRHSYDTPSHVEDVAKDYIFMEQWNGSSRGEIAALPTDKMSRFHTVSGASRTSEAVIQSIILRSATGQEPTSNRQHFSIHLRDIMLLFCVALAIALTFAKWPWLQRRKLWVHIFMVLYIGIISADLLAQSLLVSWAKHGIPWTNLAGLVILAATAFVIPWSTGKPIYCTHICPHGHAQRWLMKIIPANRKLRLPPPERWSFSLLPGLLLATVLIIALADLPIDLAGLEPFDAWALKGIGIATVCVAFAGLLFSLFVPMGYCRYGCPTGFLLNLVKKEKSGFCRRDIWLLVLLTVALLLRQY